jgi:ATP-dependent Zn protease
MNEWSSLLVSWLPFLLLIGVWLWFSRTAGMKARPLRYHHDRALRAAG